MVNFIATELTHATSNTSYPVCDLGYHMDCDDISTMHTTYNTLQATKLNLNHPTTKEKTHRLQQPTPFNEQTTVRLMRTARTFCAPLTSYQLNIDGGAN